ncbi:MAG: TIGR03032 family protein [Planctomycetota bacterium]
MTASTPQLEIAGSRDLPLWLAEHRVSLGFSTYQAGKMFLVGLQPDGRLSIFERTFNRAMGMWSNGQTIYLSSLYQLWRFENYLAPHETTRDGYDRLFVPVVGHTTGDIDIHDIAVDRSGEVAFVSTLFNCIASPSVTHSFRPVWRPSFISAMAPEDRCHLNGMATDPDGGVPRYATAVSRSDVPDGWRDRRHDGGVLIDIASGDIAAEGLSMPHSPRLHPDYPGRVWLLNSGTGDFGYVDLSSGAFEPVAFCPGYLRGLAFVGRFAVVGLSTCREDRTFGGLALEGRLREKDAAPRCAVHIIDLETGQTPHFLRIDGVIRELYDIVTLPGVARPMALGFKSDEIRRAIAIEL